MRLVRYTYPTYRNVPTGFQRSPWTGLENEIDRLFETAFQGFTQPAAGQFPVDLYQDKDNTFVRAELPGVNRDDINVEVADGTLTITAARKTPATEGQAEEAVSYTRSVTLNDEVQTDNIAAAYENGVLTVTLPKRAEVKPKKVTVAIK